MSIFGLQKRCLSREKTFTIFFLLNYEKGAPNIKIELNKRVWEHNAYKPVWFLGVEMKIADESTLLTNKIVALTDQKMAVARDLYDSYYLLKLGYPLNEKLILERIEQRERVKGDGQQKKRKEKRES